MLQGELYRIKIALRNIYFFIYLRGVSRFCDSQNLGDFIKDLFLRVNVRHATNHAAFK